MGDLQRWWETDNVGGRLTTLVGDLQRFFFSPPPKIKPKRLTALVRDLPRQSETYNVGQRLTNLEGWLETYLQRRSETYNIMRVTNNVGQTTLVRDIHVVTIQ